MGQYVKLVRLKDSLGERTVKNMPSPSDPVPGFFEQCRPRPVLERIDTLVVNENEAASFVGVASAGIAGAQQMATTILGHGPRHVVVTLGSSGAVVASTGSCIHFPAPAVPVVDTTGAGDVLVGTLAALLADGLAPDVASSLAVERASASVSFPGARSGGAI